VAGQLIERCRGGRTSYKQFLEHVEIEHRMFSFITQNWRGKPLTS
jgi:hypothetical protein